MPNPLPLHTHKTDQLQTLVFENRTMLGEAAGKDAASEIKKLLGKQPRVRMIFAAAPSQNEFLDTLVRDNEIDWTRIDAFHMDEYIGLPQDAPQTFGRYLCDRLFDKVKPGAVHLIDSSGEIDEECRRYAALLQEAPIDIVCMGIGENGHIAFNDPPVADFRDPAAIKPVELDLACRTQQVNDGCFDTLAHVPTHAITLTIPALMSGARLFCMVPGIRKREAVMRTVDADTPIATDCPSTILRTHPNCTLYADTDSFDMQPR